MINIATDEQWEAIEQLKKRWIKRQTRQYSPKTCRVVVSRMYESIGESVPLVIQVSSPLMVSIVDTVLYSQLSSQLDSQLRIPLRSQLDSQLNSKLYSQLSSQLYSQLYRQLYSQLSSQLNSQLRIPLRSQLYSQLSSKLSMPYVGVFWRAWSGCYLGGQILGVQFNRKSLSLFVAWNECAGVWIARKGFCIVSQNPATVQWENGLLHNESGPAVKYKDGYSLWSIHGVMVDEQVVMAPETQTVNQIQNERNAEAKRIRIERYGWAAYCEHAGGQVIDSRRNDIESTSEMLLKADGFTVLLATCKTGRLFSLDVPPEIETCEQAQAWLHSGSEIDRLYSSTRVIGRS